jgi:hypothetical protein
MWRVGPSGQLHISLIYPTQVNDNTSAKFDEIVTVRIALCVITAGLKTRLSGTQLRKFLLTTWTPSNHTNDFEENSDGVKTEVRRFVTLPNLL